METMAAAEMLMEAAAMEAAAMNAQMMAEAAGNEAAAEAVAVETMAAVEMTAGGANLHGYGYTQVSTQVSNGSAPRCQAGHVDHAAEEFQGAPTCSTLRAQIGRARTRTHVKAVVQRSYPRGCRGRHPVRARGCQRSASAHRGGESPVLVVGSGWRAMVGRASPKAIQITIKWTD